MMYAIHRSLEQAETLLERTAKARQEGKEGGRKAGRQGGKERGREGLEEGRERVGQLFTLSSI